MLMHRWHPPTRLGSEYMIRSDPKDPCQASAIPQTTTPLEPVMPYAPTGTPHVGRFRPSGPTLIVVLKVNDDRMQRSISRERLRDQVCRLIIALPVHDRHSFHTPLDVKPAVENANPHSTLCSPELEQHSVLHVHGKRGLAHKDCAAVPEGPVDIEGA
eukprot:3019312-Rhodomonas_salina.1